jgi:hypothetical protein
MKETLYTGSKSHWIIVPSVKLCISCSNGNVQSNLTGISIDIQSNSRKVVDTQLTLTGKLDNDQLDITNQ